MTSISNSEHDSLEAAVDSILQEVVDADPVIGKQIERLSAVQDVDQIFSEIIGDLYDEDMCCEIDSLLEANNRAYQITVLDSASISTLEDAIGTVMYYASYMPKVFMVQSAYLPAKIGQTFPIIIAKVMGKMVTESKAEIEEMYPDMSMAAMAEALDRNLGSRSFNTLIAEEPLDVIRLIQQGINTSADTSPALGFYFVGENMDMGEDQFLASLAYMSKLYNVRWQVVVVPQMDGMLI